MGAVRSRPAALPVLLLGLALLLPGCGEDRPETAYVCPPCAPHDTLTFEHDGDCPVCGMALIEKLDQARAGEIRIHEGSGGFLIPGGPAHPEKAIRVYYHRPDGFDPESPILVVIPGAGRDAWEYRDAWVPAAEEHGVLVLSPHYAEGTYGFEDYHMGGLVESFNALQVGRYVEDSHQFVLDEERLEVTASGREETWIFQDFDRLFEQVAGAVGSERTGYDLFGHSAGGQILHRLVLVHPESRAERIVAANSGFYTLPSLEVKLPFGLRDTGVREEDLRASFRQRLVLLLGEEDDHPEAGGTFLRSPSADAQGSGRLQRGRHFYEAGKARATELGAEFRWGIDTVPGAGHDFRAMTQAAASYLYGDGGR